MADHTFHIPVLGIGFSIDTPLKVARYGITSVLSLVDDSLMEHLRKHYLEKNGLTYCPISDREEDARAKRITAYLNMINDMVADQFDTIKRADFEPGSDMHNYFNLLPDNSMLKGTYLAMLSQTNERIAQQLQHRLREKMVCGKIEVNIMTKVDKANTGPGNIELPVEYNDAHASLRGFAHSDLNSGIVFSAGLNPRLYSYMSTFRDFYPDADGRIRKHIIVKVSDFRSALIQGKFLAKKGLWVSEFRIESGLNCGGHAFATEGLLLGPILEELNVRRDELHHEMMLLYRQALNVRNMDFDERQTQFAVTAQGGVGTVSEHDFLLRHYKLNSVGWGSPFLLVPEVMNVPDETLELLRAARTEDLYLSDVSPLGVPFNNIRRNEKDNEKHQLANSGKPGSPCIKKFLSFNTEYGNKPLCTASITFLKHKINDLREQHQNEESFTEARNTVIEKACLCEGLSVSALNVNLIDLPKLSKAVSVCPGPNLAYFSRISTLRQMVDHIYGRINIMTDPDRPHMFVKELQLYIDYFQRLLTTGIASVPVKTSEYLRNFADNLQKGIEYYRDILHELQEESAAKRERICKELEILEEKLCELMPAVV